jgi:DNA-binding PadR family transcriptional regulator
MENIILSLLLIKSMTIYEMRMFIQQCLNTVCSDSLGSIQAAIQKLKSKNCIVFREYTEKSLIKKEYSITETGLTQFKAWIQVPMNLQKIKNMEEGKFFFLGMVPKEVRIQSLNGYIDSLMMEQEKLVQIQKFVEYSKENAIQTNVVRIKEDEHLSKHLLEVSGETTLELAVKNIYKYQVYNLEYGLKRIQDDITFYKNILERELSDLES